MDFSDISLLLFLCSIIFLVSLVVNSFFETSLSSRKKIVLKKGGIFVHKNLQLADITLEDIEKICRESYLADSAENMDVYYLSNGDIEVIKSPY